VRKNFIREEGMTLNTIQPGTFVATFIGLVIAGIVWATMSNTPIPLLGSDRAALVAVVVLGFAMCVTSGLGSTATELPTGPLSMVAAISGILTLVVLGAVIFGWTAVIDPFAGVVYGSGSNYVADKLGVLMVGVLIAISWLAATIRQLGVVVGAAATS
jgi:hypothetical protein